MAGRWKCLINRHTPDRREIAFDFAGMASHCRSCGAPIRRLRHKVWVRDPQAVPERHGASPR